MKYLTIIYAVVLASVLGLFLLSCAQAPTSVNIMAECKKICRGPVLHYQDDTIECVCKELQK